MNQTTGLETAVLGLRFNFRQKLVTNGMIAVKCVAKIGEVYLEKVDAHLYSDQPYIPPKMEGRASHGK